MSNTPSDTPQQDYFTRMVQLGEVQDLDLLDSANQLLAFSEIHQQKIGKNNETNDPEQRYKDAVRLGHSILSLEEDKLEDILVGLNEPHQQFVEKVANVLGHLRLSDAIHSGELVHRYVGLQKPNEDNTSLTRDERDSLAFRRNNAIPQAGTLWSGTSFDRLDPPPIHEARARIGEAAYAEFGPDLGPNLTALAYSSVLLTVTLTDDLRHRLPEQVAVDVAGRYRTSTLHKTQINTGRAAIIEKLGNAEPAFPINTERLAETMDSWSSQVIQQAEKLEFIQKLFYVSGREVPEWIDVAKSAVSRKGLEPDLATAYKLHNALANVLAFDAEKSGFKMFKTILDNARIINLVDRAYIELNRQPTPTVFIAKAVIEGKQVDPIIEETQIHQPTAIGQTVAMIKKIVKEIPSGTSPETALKIIKRSIQDRPISKPKNKPKSSDTTVKPAQPLKPVQTSKPNEKSEPQILDSTEIETPQILPVRSFSIDDVSDLPSDIQDILIQYSIKTRRPLEAILNDAVQLYVSGHPVRAILKKPLKALLAQVKDSQDSE